MILDQLASNVELAAFHCHRLMAMRSLNPAANIGMVLGPILSPGYVAHYLQPLPSRLGIYVGGNNYRVVIYCDGVQTSEQASALIDGYDNSDQGLGANPYNAWLRTQANDFYLQWATLFPVQPEYLDFVGYSAGGALATYLLRRFMGSGLNLKFKTITFGAPRAVNASARAAMSGQGICRWMTDGDPIPLIPPRATDVPALIAVQPLLRILRYGNYVHTDGGISISSDGSNTPSILPLVASLNVAASLASWMLGVENSPNNPHALTSYQGAIDAAVAMTHSPARMNLDVGRAEMPANDAKADLTNMQRAAVNIVNTQGHAQNEMPTIIPAPLLMRPVKVGRIWCVEFSGRIICQAPIEKRARAIARAGNAFLRSLPKQAIVDIDALQAQLESFLQLAQVAGGGFNPTIKTGLSS